jgi:hypothetical protein
MDMSSSQDLENFPILSKAKYPVIVWKLAIVHAASRGNFMGKLLKMDRQDLENAIGDLEEYHSNMIAVFNYWQEHSSKDLEIKSANKLIHKFRRHFRSLSTARKGYTLDCPNKGERPKGENGEEVDKWLAKEDAEGTWFDEPMLKRYAKLKEMDFTEAINTLQGMRYVKKRVALVREKHPVTFYRWHEAGEKDEKIEE